MTIKGGERRRDTISFVQQPLVRAVSGRGRHRRAEGPDRDDAEPPGARDRSGALPEAAAARRRRRVLEDGRRRGHHLARVADRRRSTWTAFNGEWTLYALFQGWHGKQVERAAPGGEGNVIDHFARQPITDYLRRFDRAFAGRNVRVRSFFNDSYEVDDASGQGDWTTRMFDEFQARRGYDLRHHLPALLEGGTSDTARRVLSDYRQTVSDLVLDGFTQAVGRLGARRAAASCAIRRTARRPTSSTSTPRPTFPRPRAPSSRASSSRRRRRTSPASASRRPKRRRGSPSTSSPSSSDVRAALDNFFLGGVNHVVYHGSAYSPASEPWPGRLFYAAVEFTPQNSWWRDFAELNAYATRVQSFMQSGQPDNDVLLYFPIFDRFAERARVRGRESTSGGFSMPGAAPAGGFTSQGVHVAGHEPDAARSLRRDPRVGQLGVPFGGRADARRAGTCTTT